MTQGVANALRVKAHGTAVRTLQFEVVDPTVSIEKTTWRSVRRQVLAPSAIASVA